MQKNRATDVTGDLGQALAQTVLTPIATVVPGVEGDELDFYCQLRAHAGCGFFVQAKGSANPTYSDGSISALPVRRSTIVNNWFQQQFPVFLLMSDTYSKKTFQLRVSRELYEEGGSETFTFKIPSTNEVTTENVGELIPAILKLQPKFTPERAIQLATQFQQEHPFICHDLDQIDSCLEIMRGSDQMAQVQAKLAMKSLAESGKLDSPRLQDGLIDIFRNCKDRITQSHTLDAIVSLKVQRACGEIIKQIDRNTRLYEYLCEPGTRHTYIDHLFHAIAQLNPPNIKDHVARFIEHPDPDVLRGTIGLIGKMKISGFVDRLISLLDHKDESVRRTASGALAALNQKNAITSLAKLVDHTTSARQLAGAIHGLSESGQFDLLSRVSQLKAHSSAEVRSAVASFLGRSRSAELLETLLDFLEDSDHNVRAAAAGGVIHLSAIDHQAKEEAILTRLKASFQAGREIQASSLMGLLAGLATEKSREVLLTIYRDDDGQPASHVTYDSYGNWETATSIDLKTQALGILTRFEISDLYPDIVESVRSHDLDLMPFYLDLDQARVLNISCCLFEKT